ncbi:MAG: hypothetical protein NVS4B12_25690 [Ktedonobacteraceae bacterium]
MATILRRGAVVFLTAVCAVALALVGMSFSSGVRANTVSSATSNVVGLPGYDVSVFAKGTKAYYNPDSVEVDGKYVWIGYQNTTAKDGTDGKSSTIVEYSLQGKVVSIYSVLGHCDGLRIDPKTHLVWATSNEDGNPQLAIINPATHTVKEYSFPKAPHGGGYDDLAFLNGQIFIAASNPTLNSAGVNVFPAVDKVTWSSGKIVLTPILYGNSTAIDTITHQKVTLNMTDPDSMSIDTHGNLVQDDQADAQLIFISNPGTSKQTVTRTTVGTQVDDTIWIPSSEGSMLIVDTKQNATYAVTIDKTGFTRGTVYTESPSDSGVAGYVGTVDLKTGTIVPVIIGLTSPSGLGFISDN